MNVLRVLHGGLLTTLQDRGRVGAQRFGVPVGGAMDRFSYEIANRLLGNPLDAAALEITGGNAAFEILAPTLLAVTGAPFRVFVNGEPVPLWTSMFVRAGTILQIGGRRGNRGARNYLAVAGGLDVAVLVGSRSTYLAGGWGGFGGRALRTGDVLAAYDYRCDPLMLAGRSWPETARPAYENGPTLRLLRGPHLDLFAADALPTLLNHAYEIGAHSNRMGYRLQGPQLAYAAPIDLPSLPVLPGVVQVPPDGQPILLMADAQPTGGYPVIGVVIGPDLPLAAQLLPGDRVRFRLITVEEAYEAAREMAGWRRALPQHDELMLMVWAGRSAYENWYTEC